jgi:threonine/homoserine/homoserine lactone efflux protein
MNAALMEGVSMGLLLSALIGPVFFSLIQNSIENGFRHSFIMAMGILCSDLIYVLISYFGVSYISRNPIFEIILGYLGSVVLIGFGIYTFMKKRISRPGTGGFTFDEASKATGFIKGFSINGINPFVMLFWISIAGIINIKQDFGSKEVILYYFGILGTVFLIDLIKVYVAKQLRKFVTPRFMVIMNRMVAVVLIIFGSRLFKFALDRHLLLD